MLLNADLIDPAELTGYVRAALLDFQVNRFTLSRFLPNNVVDDIDYRFVRGGEGLLDAAVFRAYDAESSIGTRPGLARVTGELPPISRKVRLGEYDRLRQRQAEDQIRTGILSDAERMTRQVAARMELARGEVLVKGKMDFNENGLIFPVDFGRAAGHTVSAATAWSDTTNADPIADLLSWQQTYTDTNGDQPGVVVFSTRVLGFLQNNAKFRQLAATTAGTPGIVSRASVSAVLEAYGLPPFEIYDAKVKVNGAATRIIADDKVLLLPAPGNPDDPESTDLGGTFWGTTAESLEPEFNIADGEAPGIVAGAYSTKDPVAVWTKAAAIGLPVLANPDLSFCADVA